MHEKIKNYLAERFITPPKPRSKFVKALMETRPSRDRLKIGRTGLPGKVTTTKGKPGGERGQTTTGEEAAKQEVARLKKPLPVKRPTAEKQHALKAWTEYQRIGRILAERRGPPGPESERYDPEHGEHPDDPRRRETGSGSDFKPGEGPKDPRKMTPAERAALERKTAEIRAKRDAARKQAGS